MDWTEHLSLLLSGVLMTAGVEGRQVLAKKDTEDDRLETGVQMLSPFVDNDVDEVVARC